MHKNLRQDCAIKSPKPRKRGDAYRIEIMIDGKRLSCTRDTAKECESWAANKLLEHKAGILPQTAATSSVLQLGELLQLYHSKVGKHKGAKDTELVMQRVFMRDFAWLAQMPIDTITAKDLTDWQQKRLTLAVLNTVLQLMNCWIYWIKNVIYEAMKRQA